MSDESDSWLAGIGVDVQGIIGSVQEAATAVVDDVKNAGAAVWEQAQGAVSTAAAAVTDDAPPPPAVPAPTSAAPTGAAAGGGSSGLSIKGSVGAGGQNDPEDVKAVQSALGLGADGACSPATIDAIKGFQASIGMSKPDGRVDAGGKTSRALAGRGGGAAAGAPNAFTNDVGAGSAPDGASPAQSAPVEDKIPFIPGETAIDVVEVEGAEGSDAQPASGEQGGEPDTPGPATATARIKVDAVGDGSFRITGTGFRQRNVSVRAADDFMGNRFFPVELKDETIDFTTPRICVGEGPIHFSVLAGTFPLVSDILSNFAHSQCGPQEAPKDDEDKPDEPSEKPDDSGEESHQTIGVTIENADLAHDIFLNVQDLNSGQVVVARALLKATERMPLTLQADKDGKGKIHWAALQVDSPAGTQPKEDTVERITAGQNISTGLH